jgi:inner membrane transporter RhtA
VRAGGDDGSSSGAAAPAVLLCAVFADWIIVTFRPTFKPAPLLLPIALLLVAMVCFQLGAALAKQLFPAVGASGTVALRLGLAGLLMTLVWRPWLLRPSAREARIIVGYGLAMGLMNWSFYSSLERIPLGIAVALEFTGPLGLALLASRRPVDFLWIALAVLGLAALLPQTSAAKPLDALGVGFALGAAFFWALYIVFGQKTGNVHGGRTAALGTVIAALVMVPVGIAHSGVALFSLRLLPVACGVALLSSALPYTLEMYAMNRVPTRTFGVLMSLDPALAALSGLAFLGERLSMIQWCAIASIMGASAGSAVTNRRTAPTLLGE